MTKAKVLALLAVMAMVLIVPAVAFAQAVPPHIFIGSVTVNGLSAPSGTVVSAVVDGVEQGKTTVSASGSYTLQVSQGSGTDIVFMVDTLTATETATCMSKPRQNLAQNSSKTRPKVLARSGRIWDQMQTNSIGFHLCLLDLLSPGILRHVGSGPGSTLHYTTTESVGFPLYLWH